MRCPRSLGERGRLPRLSRLPRVSRIGAGETKAAAERGRSKPASSDPDAPPVCPERLVSIQDLVDFAQAYRYELFGEWARARDPRRRSAIGELAKNLRVTVDCAEVIGVSFAPYRSGGMSDPELAAVVHRAAPTPLLPDGYAEAVQEAGRW